MSAVQPAGAAVGGDTGAIIRLTGQALIMGLRWGFRQHQQHYIYLQKYIFLEENLITREITYHDVVGHLLYVFIPIVLQKLLVRYIIY